MLHHHPNVLRTDRKIHRPAHGGDRIAAGVPVGEIAGHGHLECAEHRDVEVSAAHHRERIGVVEVRPAGQQGHGFFPGIDEVRVFLARRRRRAHAEDSVLAVEEYLPVLRQVVADERRHADAQIHVRALRDVLRDAPGDLVAGEFRVAHRPVAAARPDIPRVTLPPAGAR